MIVDEPGGPGKALEGVVEPPTPYERHEFSGDSADPVADFRVPYLAAPAEAVKHVGVDFPAAAKTGHPSLICFEVSDGHCERSFPHGPRAVRSSRVPPFARR